VSLAALTPSSDAVFVPNIGGRKALQSLWSNGYEANFNLF
jgi:hypothetical protein